MSGDSDGKRFTLDPDRTAFTLRDLDNAQPRPQPPRKVALPHPRLAPPGMSGVKSSEKLGLPRQPVNEAKRLPGEAGYTTRVFKPLVQKTPGKAHTPER